MSNHYWSTQQPGEGRREVGTYRPAGDGLGRSHEGTGNYGTTDPPDEPVPESDERVREVGRDRVVAREKEAYGGIKIGSAFFGWLTATGTAVLLTAVLTGAGTAIGVAANTTVGQAATAAGQDSQTVGVAGGLALLVILFIAYYCGGYVAGRMARFDGVKQGLAVWLWGVVIAIVVGLVAAGVGSRYNILARLDSFPRVPVDEGDVTTGGIIALVIVVAAALAGALLGGLAGMRFHRNVDKVGLGR